MTLVQLSGSTGLGLVWGWLAVAAGWPAQARGLSLLLATCATVSLGAEVAALIGTPGLTAFGSAVALAAATRSMGRATLVGRYADREQSCRGGAL
jgi:hypothetical protein